MKDRKFAPPGDSLRAYGDLDGSWNVGEICSNCNAVGHQYNFTAICRRCGVPMYGETIGIRWHWVRKPGLLYRIFGLGSNRGEGMWEIRP